MKGFPASTSSLRNPLLSPKMLVVCMGFAFCSVFLLGGAGTLPIFMIKLGELTVADFVERLIVAHAEEHLEQIRAALSG